MNLKSLELTVATGLLNQCQLNTIDSYSLYLIEKNVEMIVEIGEKYHFRFGI